jgi:ubiquinone/menaquinone biosynthesis C-methylase UbiE
MRAFERLRDLWQRFAGRGTYPHELAFLLLMPGRGFILSPARLVERLHLEPAARVLEIGPGPGYFSLAVAGSLPRGMLCLFDLQREMLVKATARLRRAGAGRTCFVQGNATVLPFGAGVFDVVFLVAVLGEVPDPAACVAAAARVLCPGGLLSITELPGDPDALTRSEVTVLATAAGFEASEILPLRGGFTANFRKPPGDQSP